MEDRLINEVSAIMGDRPAHEIIKSTLEKYNISGVAEDIPTYGLLRPTTNASSGVLTLEALEGFLDTLKNSTSEPLPIDSRYFTIGRIDGPFSIICPGYNKRKPTRAARLRKIKRRRNRAAERRRRKGLA